MKAMECDDMPQAQRAEPGMAKRKSARPDVIE
jgi:hypothetical protein